VSRSSFGKQQRETARAERALGSRREPAGLTEIYLANGTVTSGGTGPGTVRVPPAEAAALVRDRLAICGERPPQDWADHAQAMAPRMRPR
jgi:hypothetical protein